MSVIRQEQQLNPFQFLWYYRRLIWYTTLQEIKAKYTTSILGIGWAALYPLLFLTVYVLVFIVIFRLRLPDSSYSRLDYVLIIFAGLIPWLGFREAVMVSLSSVVSNASILRSTSFPTPVLPVKTVLASTITQVISLGFLLIVLLFTGHLHFTWLFLPIAIATQLMLTIGMGWVLAVLNVYFRDMEQVVSLILFMLLFISPVAYLPEMIGSPWLQLILYINPISYLITLYRLPLFYNQLPSIQDVMVILGLALAMFWFGYRFFVGVRAYVVDYV